MLALLLAGAQVASAWGIRGHQTINRTAVRLLPEGGPVFLKAHEDWIVYLAIIPDSWRSPAEPSLKILEDPNHGWFKEQFASLDEIPRSRYEFVIALYEEQKKLRARDPEAAKLTNVRWTGTLPYAAQENFERLKASMRRYRAAKAANQDTRLVEWEIASYMGRLGHYTGDGAQPLHDSIHHDGWAGENLKDYTRDPRIHGRFESRFVDLIEAGPEDILDLVGKPSRLSDPFTAILHHLDEAASHVVEVYRLDKEGALADKSSAAGRKLVYDRLAAGARLLRDLTYTAWLASAEPAQFSRENNPINPTHPNYNPATGSAPPGPAIPNRRQPDPGC